MKYLSKKIASIYMQKQAGSGSLLAFPSVMFNLKELSNQAKDQVSGAIVDGLTNVFHGIIQSADGKYQVKVLKQEEDIYSHSKQVSLSIQVELESVAEVLADHLNSEEPQFFAHKNLAKDVLKDLKEGSYLNAVAMFVKQEIKSSNIRYATDHVEEFLSWIGNLDLDFIGMNSMEGSQYLEYSSVAVKDVSWSLNTMDFLVAMEVIYVLDPDPNGY